MRIPAALLVTVVASAMVVGGCGNDDASDSAAAATASGSTPSASPTPALTLEEEQALWAGRVCRSQDRLAERVGALGQNLAFDLGMDASVLDQLDRQLRVQVLSVASAANDLGAVLVTVPVDPVQANDWLVAFTEAQGRTQDAIDRTTGHLDAMLGAPDLASGLSEGVSAVSAGVEAFEAAQRLVTTAQTATEQAQEEFGPAFQAAPECQRS